MAGHLQVRRRAGGSAILLAAGALCISQLAFQRGPLTPALVAGDAGAAADAGSFVADNSHALAGVVMLLACLLAKTERTVTPPAVVPLEKRPDYVGVVFINSWISLTAGMLNALAFLEMAATIAHHSGNLTHWGRNWGMDSFRFACYLGAFMFGGVVVGYVKSDCEGIFVGRYSPSMLSAFVAAAGGTYLKLQGGEALATLVLWAFALGIQNGLCRKFSSMPLCSTHFTGYLTDAGNGFGTWVRAKVFGETSPPMMKPALFMSCMLSFAAGGFAAKLGRDSYGIVFAFLPALFMLPVAFGVFPLPAPAPADKK